MGAAAHAICITCHTIDAAAAGAAGVETLHLMLTAFTRMRGQEKLNKQMLFIAGKGCAVATYQQACGSSSIERGQYTCRTCIADHEALMCKATVVRVKQNCR